MLMNNGRNTGSPFRNKGVRRSGLHQAGDLSNEKVLWWYKQNTILFVENDYLQSDARLKAEFEKTEGMPQAVIHPQSVSPPSGVCQDGCAFRGCFISQLTFTR